MIMLHFAIPDLLNCLERSIFGDVCHSGDTSALGDLIDLFQHILIQWPIEYLKVLLHSLTIETLHNYTDPLFICPSQRYLFLEWLTKFSMCLLIYLNSQTQKGKKLKKQEQLFVGGKSTWATVFPFALAISCSTSHSSTLLLPQLVPLAPNGE